MSILKSIQPELQHIVDAMCAVANIDITIVDHNLSRMAGTGRLSLEHGSPVPENSAFSHCLATGKQYYISDPDDNPVCRGCSKFGRCGELAELCIPIKLGGKTIGVLGICAFSEHARDNFVRNFKNYIQFENQLSLIISSMLNEHRYGMLAEHQSSELDTLINAIDRGIVILSENGSPVTINRYLMDRLGFSAHTIPNFEMLVGKKNAEWMRNKGFEGEFGPVRLAGDDYIISANPIFLRKQQVGVVLVFSDFGKMQASVLQAERKSEVVNFSAIIGESEVLSRARSQAQEVAGTDASVFLYGETGVGKEVFARAIHFASRRKSDVFMPINCSAIPDALIESELFGYEKGAFTGAATSGKLGLLEICKNGTLFLDEVGDIPLSMQIKLLRTIEEKEIMRVGGSRPLRVNPRVISAAQSDLHQLLEEKNFRKDLFYRLNVVPIHIPPLRERGGDIMLLANVFLKRYCSVYQKDIAGFTDSCAQLLQRYDFPGNIRELRNIVEYAVLFERGRYVTTECICEKLSLSRKSDLTLAEQLREFERAVIERELLQAGDSLRAKKEIAQRLGISLTTLYRKMGLSEDFA
ncbi:sigma-54-dependent Fis family transcriptional regulator [Oscillospiraceae bacterium LTW-04]|nr:sigma 54-interacting transcriptional regulator [Oscillospiraceae bacterium MB24-C1]